LKRRGVGGNRVTVSVYHPSFLSATLILREKKTQEAVFASWEFAARPRPYLTAFAAWHASFSTSTQKLVMESNVQH